MEPRAPLRPNEMMGYSTPRRFHAIAALLGLATAVWMTWPVVLHPFDHLVDGALLVDPSRPEGFMAGNIGSDVFLIAWILSWNLHAMSNYPLHLFDANIFYPTSAALARTEHLFAIALLSAPGALLGGPVFGNQTALMLCIALNVWTTAFVVMRWTGSSISALAAGALFGASPFHQANFAHVQNLATASFPILLFAMHRLAGDSRPRSMLLVAGALTVQVLSCQYLALYALIVAVALGCLLLGFQILVRSGELWRTVSLLVAAALLAGLAVLPFALPYLRLASEHGLPNAIMLIRRGAIGMVGVSSMGSYAFGDEHLTWLPVPELVWPLAALGVVALLAGTGRDRLLLTMLLSVGALGATLALGPIGAPRLYDITATVIPGFQSIREPWRAAVLLFLALSLLAGHGGAVLTRRFRRLGTVVVAAVTIVAAVSRWPGPIPLRRVPTGVDVPPVYHYLTRCGEGDPVLELPMYRLMENWREGQRIFLSTTHWLPLVNGRASYAPDNYERFIGLAARSLDPVARAELREATGVRWLVVHCAEARLRPAYAAWCASPVPFPSHRFAGDVLLVDLGPAERLPREWTPRWSAHRDCFLQQPLTPGVPSARSAPSAGG